MNTSIGFQARRRLRATGNGLRATVRRTMPAVGDRRFSRSFIAKRVVVLSCAALATMADQRSRFESGPQIELASVLPKTSPEINTAQLTPTAAQLSGLKLPFIENQGQHDAEVRFSASTFAGTVFVTRDGELVYSLPE